MFHYEGDDTSDESFLGDEPTSINQIPLQVHYINGNGKIRTRAGIGYDLMIWAPKGETDKENKAIFFSPSLNFGIINKLTNSSDLSIGFNIQATPVYFRALLLSLDLGVRFNLAK